VIYRPRQIGTFEFAVVAALRAEQLRRGCVARVEGHHKVVVTAQLEVIAGKTAKLADGAAQDAPDAVVLTQTGAALSDEPHRDTDTDVTLADAPTPVELADAEMVRGRLTRGQGS
jgi:hypothetical protein